MAPARESKTEELERMLDAVHQCPGICSPRAQELPAGSLVCPECWTKIPTPARNRIHAAVRGHDIRKDEDTYQWVLRSKLRGLQELRRAMPQEGAA